MLTLQISNSQTNEVMMQLSMYQYIYNVLRREIRFKINPLGSSIHIKCDKITFTEDNINIHLKDTSLEELEEKLWR